MKINAKVDILFSPDGLRINIIDADASTNFVRLHLDPQQTVEALSRIPRTHVTECLVMGLDRVGKQMEMASFEFPLPKHGFEDRKAVAVETVKKVCEPGWTPDTSFSSQGSFFQRDGKEWARTTIRRWVGKEGT